MPKPSLADHGENMAIISNQRILLTGAGFTHNFGAPLAKDMWALVYNNRGVQSSARIKNLLLREFDYESVYHEVITGDFSVNEKSVLTDAIAGVYNSLDETIRNYVVLSNTSQNALHLNGIFNLINKFAGINRNEKGFVFTLNQDLFIERHYLHDGLLSTPLIPGVQRNQDWFTARFCHVPISNSQLFTSEELEKTKDQLLQNSNFFYIKLHGSQNWTRPDGTNSMVIGYAKKDQIQQEPLLSWYFDIFEQVLCQPNRLLLSIGYRFRDVHINRIIVKAIEKHGLKLYIISPSPPADLKKEMEGEITPTGMILWSALAGYINGRLADIFPVSQETTGVYRELCDVYFDGEKI